MTAPDLFVSFAENLQRVSADDVITFGRLADIEIDDNKYLHRVTGRFAAVDNSWILQNVGSRISLALRGDHQCTPTILPPGQQTTLSYQTWTLSFEAGTIPYELRGWFDEPARQIEPVNALDGTETVPFGYINVSAGQRIVLTALCENLLLGRPHAVIPSNKQIAARLQGLASKKAVERRLDVVADKMHAVKVRGVKGAQGALADQRRPRMARHAIQSGVIRQSDLALLPPLSQ